MSGPVQIVGLPWPRRSVLLSRDSVKNLTFDQLNEQLQDLLTRLLFNEAEPLDSSIPAILSAHVTVAQATVGSERSMMIGNDHVILLSNVGLFPSSTTLPSGTSTRCKSSRSRLR